MRAELTGTTAALGFLLLACTKPADPARSAATQGSSGQASATLGDCAGGTGRSRLQSKCIETPMDSHEPEYQYIVCGAPVQSAEPEMTRPGRGGSFSFRAPGITLGTWNRK